MIYYAPTNHIGHYTFPEGCRDARVFNCPALTSVTFPEGCTYAQVEECPGLTSVTFPEGCTLELVENCPGLTSVNGVLVNSAAEAEPYLREIAKFALAKGALNMGLVRKENECGTVACIAGWAGVLFPYRVRQGLELVDSIPLLGTEAASMFFKSTYEGRAFLMRFAEAEE